MKDVVVAVAADIVIVLVNERMETGIFEKKSVIVAVVISAASAISVATTVMTVDRGGGQRLFLEAAITGSIYIYICTSL